MIFANGCFAQNRNITAVIGLRNFVIVVDLFVDLYRVMEFVEICVISTMKNPLFYEQIALEA